MTFHLAGWRVRLEADAAGRDYWRAYRGAWQRGAHSPASLLTLMRECPQGEPRGTREGAMDDLLNTITTGDARDLTARIPDASVDLVFTDPEYSRRELYDWLGKEARRVLKPGGVLLCWSNGKWHHHNARWLEDAGLTWRYDFGCIASTGPAPMCGKVIAKTNRLMWLDVDGRSKMRGYLADGYTSLTMPSLYSQWSWSKNPVFSAQALEAFAPPDALVLDPFSGEGTTGAICTLNLRRFIGFEIDPAVAERARVRIAGTQAPHPLLVAEQMSLEEAA